MERRTRGLRSRSHMCSDRPGTSPRQTCPRPAACDQRAITRGQPGSNEVARRSVTASRRGRRRACPLTDLPNWLREFDSRHPLGTRKAPSHTDSEAGGLRHAETGFRRRARRVP